MIYLNKLSLDYIFEDIQFRVQAPYEMVAASVLATAAASVQDALQVQMPNGYVAPTSLYFITIAESGERKSGTMKLAANPIFDRQAKLTKLNEDRAAKLAIEKKISKTKLNRLLKELGDCDSDQLDETKLELCVELGNKVYSAPKEDNLIYDNCTIEALLEGLHRSDIGGFWISSEGSSILRGLNTTHVASLNKLWDKEVIDVKRKSSESYTITDTSLSMHLALQPDLFYSIVNDKHELLRGSGLLARCLTCIPVSRQGFRSVTPQPNYPLDIHDYYTRINDLMDWQANYIKKNDPYVICFDDEAQNLWLYYSQQLEKGLYENGAFDSIRDFVNKLSNNIARIAAIWHFYHYAVIDEGDMTCSPINADSMQKAIDIGEYYRRQAMLLYGELCGDFKAQKLGKLLYSYLFKQYCQTKLPTLRSNILKNGPRELRNKNSLDQAVDCAINFGYLQVYYPDPNKLVNICYLPIIR